MLEWYLLFPLSLLLIRWLAGYDSRALPTMHSQWFTGCSVPFCWIATAFLSTSRVPIGT